MAPAVPGARLSERRVEPAVAEQPFRLKRDAVGRQQEAVAELCDAHRAARAVAARRVGAERARVRAAGRSPPADAPHVIAFHIPHSIFHIPTHHGRSSRLTFHSTTFHRITTARLGTLETSRPTRLTFHIPFHHMTTARLLNMGNPPPVAAPIKPASAPPTPSPNLPMPVLPSMSLFLKNH